MLPFYSRIRSKVIFFVLICTFSLPALSCSRLLHVDHENGVMVGRTMDWFQEMQTDLVVFPRGMTNDGQDKDNALKWVSKYGSVVAMYHNLGATDGMNEKGLAAHILWLSDSDYGVRNRMRPGLSLIRWAQFYLDNFATVAEAVSYTQLNSFQLVSFTDPVSKKIAKVHMAIEDASGDSAIIEYLDGQPVIYHHRDYRVMTNEPIYSIQLKNLQEYEGLGGKKPLPGTDNPSDRFVRAAYHEKKLPKIVSTEAEVNAIMSILENVSRPHEYYNDTAFIASTLWRTISDLTHHVYYFNSTKDYTMNYTRLDQFDLRQGAPVMKFVLAEHPTQAGDITKAYQPIK